MRNTFLKITLKSTPALAGICLCGAFCTSFLSPAFSEDAKDKASDTVASPVQSETAEKAPVKIETPPIAVTFALAQNISGLGRVVAFSLTARNASTETQTLTFNSSQNFDITATPIKDGVKVSNPVWRWSNDKLFTAALRSEKLLPGESKIWSAVWQGDDNLGNFVTRGQYLLEAMVMANGGLKAAPLQVEVRNDGIRQIIPGKNDLDAGLNAKLETDKAVYKRGEIAQLTLTFKNQTGLTTGITYPSGQRYDFAVRPAPKGKFDPKQKIIWQWSAGRAFTMMLGMKQLVPDETMIFQDKWELKDNKGQPVPPGRYAIEGMVAANRGIAAAPLIIEVQ